MHWFTSLYRELSKRERVVALISVAGVLAGALGLGSMVFFRTTIAAPAEGGIYREGIVGQPSFVNPVVAKSPADKALTALLFSDLKELAASIETADQGKTVKLRLKEGLSWSDGRQITSDDVIFTIDRIKDVDTGSPLASSLQGVSAERVSQLEVVFKLPAPYAFFEDTLRAIRPLPKHLYSEIPASNWKLSDYNIRPIGSGPFSFSSRIVETDGFISSYRLKANERSLKKPFLEGIEIVFYRNQDELVKAFNSGSIEGFFVSDPSLFSAIKRPYHTASFNSPTYYAVFWNQTSLGTLSIPEVRKALEISIDRPALTASVLGEQGAVSTDPLSPSFFPPFESTSSLERAGELLDKAGWKMNEGGVRSKKIKGNEVPMEITLSVPDIAYLVKTADKLAETWTGLGIKVKVDKMPLEALLAGPIKNRTYEAILFGNTLTESGDLFPFWHSSGRLYPGLNLALYEDKAADKLISQIREELSLEKRRALTEELRKAITEDSPALFLFSPRSTYATGKNIKGIEPSLITDPSSRFLRASEWYMTTKRVLR